MKHRGTLGGLITAALALGVMTPAPVYADEKGRTGPNNAITDVPGVTVGHYTDTTNVTGTTALILPDGALAGADVRGGAPGTVNTDALQPVALQPDVHGLFLSGGSWMGLSPYAGVVQYLRERGLGSQFGGQAVPAVGGAIVFDLGQGADTKQKLEKTPDFEFGYRAAKAAKSGPVAQGSVGAGTGTGTPGPTTRMKGGVGTASVDLGNGLYVGALVVLNSGGRVWSESQGCELYALYMELQNEFGDTKRPTKCTTAAPALDEDDGKLDKNTTIGVVATNAKLTSPQLQKMAQVAHDGLARAIRPAHTMGDGDAIFSLSTRKADAPDGARFGAILDAAASAFSRGVVHATLRATPLAGRQTYCQVFTGACTGGLTTHGAAAPGTPNDQAPPTQPASDTHPLITGPMALPGAILASAAAFVMLRRRTWRLRPSST
ncbi:P1 family peptidase [Actinomadura soli]|uniref:P1 family peptidase n=1 Tax=Actinomadura soli TaxID=2508997 RepID=A0A5C4JBM5_9ACTN|nr:P1 family peptidase [Actinomadura soli]TMR00608.1 P1 family peptidase [Actinomadura soli]